MELNSKLRVNRAATGSLEISFVLEIPFMWCILVRWDYIVYGKVSFLFIAFFVGAGIYLGG